MNPLVATFMQPGNNKNKTKNNLLVWLKNTKKPTFHQLKEHVANLPIQNFVRRHVHRHGFYYDPSPPQHRKGSSFSSQSSSVGGGGDDHSVDTMATWEDMMGIENTPGKKTQDDHKREIKQTVVYISREDPVCDTTMRTRTIPFVPDRQEERTHKKEMAAKEKYQHKSQHKNKVLMLLQLEQILATRTSIRKQWRKVRDEFFFELVRSQIHRKVIRTRKLQEIDNQRRQRRRNQNQTQELLDLKDYYRRFDSCIEDLEDRNEIMELEGFKQLVIREVKERGEAQNKFRQQLEVVHGQLMQKFIVDELILEGLYAGQTFPRQQTKHEVFGEWIHIDDEATNGDGCAPDMDTELIKFPPVGSLEWVVCDF